MTARKIEIVVEFQYSPRGLSWFDWSLNADGVLASGQKDTQHAALRAARRRARRIQRLRSRLSLDDPVDVQRIVDAQDAS